MTLQERYESIREYFSRPDASLAQEHTGSGFCAYRTSDGRKCAVGCQIPDDLYDPILDDEIGSIGGLVAAASHPNAKGHAECKAVYDHLGLTDDETLSFMVSAQSAHDDALNVASFIEMLDNLAADRGLQVKS